MANFNSGKNIFVVLQLQKDGDVERAKEGLNSKALEIFGRGRYAYILHDKDVLDNGEIKGSHIHIVFCSDKAKSSNSWIEHFSSLLNLSPEAVSVEMQGSEKKCIRYLLHLDDGAKHQYDRSEVVTNMDDVCKKAWEASSGFVSSPTLEQLLEASKGGAKALYNLVGLAGFEKAERVISKIKGEEDLISAYEAEIYDLWQRLSEFTAKPEYLKTGNVPLKDFQDVLEDTNDTLRKMIKIRQQHAKKGN